MNLKDYGISNEVCELYERVISRVNPKKVEIYIEKPKFGGGLYLRQANGDYKIYISPDHVNDFYLSHELLHIFLQVDNILPVLVSFNFDYSDTSIRMAILMNDFISHRWIINEQQRRGISGEDVFIKEAIEGLENQKYIETGKASEDFLLINRIFSFLHDYPKYANLLKSKINNKYPHSLAYAKELLKDASEKELITPFNARRKIVRIIKKYIGFFSKEDINCDFIRDEIVVLPVFREIQMKRPANATISIKESHGRRFFITNSDMQKCSSDINKTNINGAVLAKIQLGDLVNQIKLKCYIDDRRGNWTKR